jgi:hypothetical protein
MKPNTYAILSRAVEEGVAYGWNRAHKHTPTPTADEATEAITDAVMLEIAEWFTFDDEPRETP